MKKKCLFIDRDGTLIQEPPVTFQVDTLEQLVLLPGLIRNLYRIAREGDYELVMVSNQDGLGTPAYPQAHFDTVQQKLLELLQEEGIRFAAIHIDTSRPEEGLSTRKPGTGLLTRYFSEDYDLPGSFVIGDRDTDMQLAANLGAGGILLTETPHETAAYHCACDWDDVYRCLRRRRVSLQRNTAETRIRLTLDPDGSGQADIATGLGFFDHMLNQLARHAGLDLFLRADGDLHVDEHHTVEDTALVLGQALKEALRDKRGLARYGFCLPMDDCLAHVALDLGGRSYFDWRAVFRRERVGDLPTELFPHFFRSLSAAVECTLHIRARGDNEHHKIESIFKAFARALRQALQRDPEGVLPTTKGIL